MARARGNLFIVAAPSGGGKTTIIRRVIEQLTAAGQRAHFSVSHTTRPPRPGEVCGVDYTFVDRPRFEAMVAAGEFLEFAEVHGHLYGTARRPVRERLEAGEDVFLDIDVQGARQVRVADPEAVSVFVLPPSRHELVRRLRARGQDDAAAVELRMRNAVKEMRCWHEFHYVIINNCLEEAVQALACIVAASRQRPCRMAQVATEILADFENSAGEA